MQRLAGGWNNGVLRGAGGFLETDDWHACVATGVLIQTLFGHLLPLISAHEVEVSVLICLLVQAAQAGGTHDITLSADAPTKVVSAAAAPQFKSLDQVRVCRASMSSLGSLSVLCCCLTMLSHNVCRPDILQVLPILIGMPMAILLAWPHYEVGKVWLMA